MLPEQILRFTDALRTELTQGNIPWSSISRALALFTASARLTAQDRQPLTLTGDDWRAACEAQNREADEALDAVY